MSCRVFYFSLLALSLTACSSVNNKQASGDFDYTLKSEAKPLVIPAKLDKPKYKEEFSVSNQVSPLGPVGDEMDIRAPSLVLPIATSSRVVDESNVSTIWFDKVLEDKDLLDFIESVVIQKLDKDQVGYDVIDEELEVTLAKVFEGGSSLKEANANRQGIRTKIFESQWYENEVETGWIFTEVESVTRLRFRYQLMAKAHGRSVSLTVSLVDYSKTELEGDSKLIDPIDKQRAEKAMLNSITSLVDYNYRVQVREERLERANQKLVSLGVNTKEESAYVVEMALDKLWENMPVFFEKHGFTITDLNESKKIYYVDFTKPKTSIWDAIWGSEVPVINIANAHYRFALTPLDDKKQKTSVTIYNADGNPLPEETLKSIFPVIDAGLSFRQVF